MERERNKGQWSEKQRPEGKKKEVRLRNYEEKKKLEVSKWMTDDGNKKGSDRRLGGKTIERMD